MKQEEGRNSIATRDILSRQEVKEKYMKNISTYKFMLQHNEKTEGRISVAIESFSVATLIIATWTTYGDIRRASKKDLCHDKVMYVTTLKEDVYVMTR